MSTNQYVTVAQWLASTQTGLYVADTAADIAAALPIATTAELTRVNSFSLSASGTVSGTALGILAHSSKPFSLNGFQLTVADAAYVLLSLSSAEIKLIAHATLTGSPTLSAPQLTQLEALPGFTVAAADHVTVSDSLTNIAGAIGNHPAWFTPVSAVLVRLDGAHIGAFAAAQLGLLAQAGKTVTFTPSGANTTLTVTAAAASIAASAAGLADLTGHVTVNYKLVTPIVAVTAAEGAILAGLAGFNVGAHALPVADTGANIASHATALFGRGFSSITVSSGNFAGTAAQLSDPTLHEAAGSTVSLGSSATVSAATANELAALQGFTVAAGTTLTAQDSVANIMLLSAAALADASSVDLAASQTVSVSQLEFLAGLGAKFGEGAYTLSVQGTAAALEVVPAAALHLAGQLMVVDTAANIAAAASFAWGSAHVSYELSQPGTVTAAQAATLAGLGSAFSLNNEALSVADNAANVVAHAAALASLSIQANVTDNFADVAASEASLAALGASLASVAISDNAAQTAEAVAALSPLATKFVAGQMLTVSDTATDVSTYLPGLETVAGQLGSHLTLDVSGTAAQLAVEATALAALHANLQLTITGAGTVTAQQAVALAPYATAATLDIQDTGAAVAQSAAQLAQYAAAVGTLTLTDVGTPYSASVAAGIAASALDTHLAGSVRISVADGAANIGAALTGLETLASDGKLAGVSDGTDNAAAVAGNVAALNAVQAHVTLQDITANVQAHIDALGQVQDLTRITLTDAGGAQIPNLTFSVAQLTSDISVISAVKAASAGAQFNVLDTAANIAADLNSATSVIVTDNVELHSVTSSNGPISLTLAQEQTIAGGAFNALTSFHIPYDLTAVSLANLAAAQALSPVNIAIADSSADITANLASGSPITGGNLANIDGITVTDSGAVTLTVAQLGSLALLFTQTPSLVVSDTASDISLALAPHQALINELISDPSSITAINITGANSLTLTAAEAQQLANAGLLNKFATLLPHGATLSIATNVADLASVAAIPLGQLGHITIAVSDTAPNLAADLVSAHSLLERYSETVSSVTVAADPSNPPLTLTASGMNALYTYGFANPGNVPLLVSDTLADILAVNATSLEQANTSVTISDTAANLAADLAIPATAAALESIANALTTHLNVTLTDAAPVVNVTDAVYTANAVLLSRITNENANTGRGPVVVTDIATTLDANHNALVADPEVAKVVVVDTAANVTTGSYLADLQQLGSRLWVQLTDAQLTTSELTGALLLTAHLSTTGGGVFDTAQNIAAFATSSTAATNFLNAFGATVTSVTSGTIAVAQLESLETLTDLHTNGLTFAVQDSASGLTGAGAAAALGSSLVSGVYLQANATNMTAAAAVALFAIPKFHTADINGNVHTVTVSDSAAGIDAVHAQLAALGTQLSGIDVATGGGQVIVSAATLADLVGLQAVLTGGGTLSVSDTPANVANGLALQSQTALPSISPTSWALTASGTVTEAQAVLLGAAAGARTLTVPGNVAIVISLSADTTISAAQATNLGYLGSAIDWNLNGHHLIINDTAANLGSLSVNAIADVVPSASIVVNDGSAITATQAEGLMALLKNNTLNPNATGPLTAAQITFAHTESVVGHITDLQQLNTELQALTGQAGTGWTGNTALESAFQLTAADTVANLVALTSTNNAAFLASLAGTTVYSGQTINATTAETLATVASQIHFSLGSNTLTVQDIPSALLAAVNQAGVALATTVELPGAEIVNAPNAFALLSLHNFELTNATPLTISDTTQNLLNGQLDNLLLSSAFASDITISPLDVPTVTVAQAETLAQLGFAGTLTIADTTADLLNSANSAVVGAAANVTLVGNETVTASIAAAIAELPHFDLNAPGGTLTLAASATVTAPTLVAIASLGSYFSVGGNTLTLAANSGTVTLTASQFEALQAESAVLNGTGNTIAISDSVTNLHGLMSNAAWTGLTPSLQSAYHLVASDTATNLAGIGGAGLPQLFALQLSQSQTWDALANNTPIGELAAVVGNTSSHAMAYATGATLTLTGTAAEFVSLGSTETALANTLQVDVADAETYFGGASFAVNANQTLLVSDTATNLLAPALAADIGAHASTHVQVQLSQSGSVTGGNLATLLSLPHFGTNGNTLTLSSAGTITGSELQQIADMGAHFNSGGYTMTVDSPATLSVAELSALAGDTIGFTNGATIGVADTAANLATLAGMNALPTYGSMSVSAAGSITAANLESLATLAGAHTITDSGYAVTLSDADVLNLLPAQYEALYDNGSGILANLTTGGHVVSASFASPVAADTNSVLSFTADNVPNATVKVYNEAGGLLSSTHEGQSSFTVAASDPADHSGNGQAFAFTEVVNGVESAPVVVLDQGVIQAAVLAAGATFANNNGDVQVVPGSESLHIYTAGDNALQNLTNPALVYDPHAHTVSLDIPNSAPVVLITLGGTTDPASATALDVVVKHHQ